MKKKKPKAAPSLNRLRGGGERPHVNPVSHEWYKAEFSEGEIKDGKFGEYLLLKFKLKNGELQDGNSADGHTICAFSSIELHKGTDAHDIMSGIIGHELEEDEELDLTSHYGVMVEGFVEVDKKKGSKDEFAKITKVRTLKSSKKKSSKKKSSKKKK